MKLLKDGCAPDCKIRKKDPVIWSETWIDSCIHHETEFKEFDLSGRIAKCVYCGRKTKSDGSECKEYRLLPFFRHHLDMETDEWYCGCLGWS